MDPQAASWATAVRTNAILADIYDALSSINANLMAIGSGKPAKKPKPYPRPKNKNDDENTRKIGQGQGMTHDELEAWMNRKRAEINEHDHSRDSSS